MAKSSGVTRGGARNSSKIIASLKQSKNFFIRAGLQRYEEVKDDPRRDLSDMANLTEADKIFLLAYLSRSYRVINDGLRNGSTDAEIKAMTNGIDRAMEKLNVFAGTVYRGVKFQYGGTRKERTQAYENLLNFYRSSIGKEITEKTYLSAGKVKSKIDRKFTDSDYPSLKITIDSKTGRDVSRYNDEEREVVFRRGTKFRVISVRGNNIHLREV